MADNMDKIIDKIQKLFALATSDNEAEATSALARAHELLRKHNLSMMDIDAKNGNNGLVTEEYCKGDRYWKNVLINAIAKANYCGMFRSGTFSCIGATGRAVYTYTLNIVGKEHNVAAVKAMADYVVNAIEKGAKRLYGSGKAMVASYKVGFAQTIITRLVALRKQDMETSECRDLVVMSDKAVDDFFAKEKMKTTKVNTKAQDLAGYLLGAQDGNNLPLNDQISGDGTTTQKVALA